MKKILSVILAVVMALSLCLTAFAETVAEESKLSYLLLGDSIAFGAGVLNSDEACYGRIVANTNGYNYKNDAINGSMSKDLIKTIDRESVRIDIENADIISISIGGNDFIKGNLIPALLGAAVGYMGFVQKTLDSFYPNFCTAIEMIKEINPDAIILVQTLYNPRYVLLKTAFGRGVKALNQCYYDYLEVNPGAYEIVDVAGALEGETGFIAIDTIHPNAYGNKLIAKVILQKLYDLGLGETTTPVIEVEPVDEIALPVYMIYRLFLYAV